MAITYWQKFQHLSSAEAPWLLSDSTFLLPCCRPSQFFIHQPIKATHRQKDLPHKYSIHLIVSGIHHFVFSSLCLSFAIVLLNDMMLPGNLMRYGINRHPRRVSCIANCIPNETEQPSTLFSWSIPPQVWGLEATV